MLIIFDENIPYSIAEGLNIIVKDFEISHPTKLFNRKGVKDDELIKYAGENSAVIVTYDNDFKNIKLKGGLYVHHKIGVFFIKFDKKEKKYWHIVKQIVNNFEFIKDIISTERKPFVYELSNKGKPKRFQF